MGVKYSSRDSDGVDSNVLEAPTDGMRPRTDPVFMSNIMACFTDF